MIYAGCESLDQTALVLNDIILPDEGDKSESKRFFAISFNDEARTYSLRDLGQGTGTFIKLEFTLPLMGTKIISFGDSHMVVKVLGDLIDLKFVEGPKSDTSFTYKSEQKTITIGRMPDCTIRFTDNSLSRY